MQRWTYKQLCKLANQASSWVLFCRSVSNSSSHQTQDDTSELTYWEKGNCPDSENRQNQPSLECLLRVLQLCLAHIRDPRALIKETLPPCNWALIPARGNSIYVWNIYFLDNWHFGICYIYIYIYVLFKPTPTLRRTQRFKKGIETLLNKAKRSTHVSVPMFPASSACWAV